MGKATFKTVLNYDSNTEDLMLSLRCKMVEHVIAKPWTRASHPCRQNLLWGLLEQPLNRDLCQRQVLFRKVGDVETWFGWCPRCACYKSRDQVNIHEGGKFQALEGSGEGEVLSLRNQSLES